MRNQSKSFFISYNSLSSTSSFSFSLRNNFIFLNFEVPEKIVPKVNVKLKKKKHARQSFYRGRLVFNMACQQCLNPLLFFYPGYSVALTQVGIIKNLVKGLSKPYFLRFYVRGIGYKVWPFCSYQGLKFRIGLNHKSVYLFSKEIVGRGRKYKFVLSSLDYQKLKQTAVDVVSLKFPDPYRVKGIRYLNDNKFPKPRKEKRRLKIYFLICFI